MKRLLKIFAYIFCVILLLFALLLIYVKNMLPAVGNPPEIKVEICSQCHPFFTGTQKIVDTAGRVEKFNKRYAKSKKATEEAAKKE